MLTYSIYRINFTFVQFSRGAECNQAIMLITDGAPETYESVFNEYNKDKMVRLFTYVIGRDITQIDEVYWMACHNRGYYAQVANLAEVREQVQQYIPVMSRPLVLSEGRIFSWTPVYADASVSLVFRARAVVQFVLLRSTNSLIGYGMNE